MGESGKIIVGDQIRGQFRYSSLLPRHHAADGEAEVLVVAVDLRVDKAAGEVQAVGVVRAVGCTRPIVAVRALIAGAICVVVAGQRERQRVILESSCAITS